MLKSNPFERVRTSTRRVVETARLVKLDQARLLALAASFDPAQIRQRYHYEDDYHFLGGGEVQANYVFSLDALNFGSGLSPKWKKLEAANLLHGSLYKTVADTLRREALAGNSLDANFAANLTPADLAVLFGIPADFELMGMFANSLNELGRWVVADYGGRYINLIEAANGTAAGLVELLVSHLNYFNDYAIYEYDGQPVYFYKRAQILANDLHLAFKGQAYGAFSDIDQLTLFADNLLPHYFRMAGVLTYDPELEALIERGDYLPAGGPAEIELRASAVQCVEMLCQHFRAAPTDGLAHIFPAQVDDYLWNYSQSSTVKARPRHRTITYFY
jgi:hypothetical protein